MGRAIFNKLDLDSPDGVQGRDRPHQGYKAARRCSFAHTGQIHPVPANGPIGPPECLGDVIYSCDYGHESGGWGIVLPSESCEVDSPRRPVMLGATGVVRLALPERITR